MQRFLHGGLLVALLSGCGQSPSTPTTAPQEKAAGTASPLNLKAGQPICKDGEKLAIPAGTFLKKHANAPSGEPPVAVRKVVQGNAQGGEWQASELQMMLKGDKTWQYTIRPLKGYLRVQVQKGAIPGELQEDNDFIIFPSDRFFEANPGITWVEQPYKVQDRKGTVVYQTP